MKITCKCNSSCQLIRWSKVPCTSKSKIILVIDEIKEMESSTYFEIYENGLWNIFVVLSSTTTKKKPKEVMPKRTCENIKLLMTQKQGGRKQIFYGGATVNSE